MYGPHAAEIAGRLYKDLRQAGPTGDHTSKTVLGE